MNVSSGALLLLSLICTVNSHEKVFTDSLRWEFLLLEDNIWDFILKDPVYTAYIEPQVVLAEKFYKFDENFKQRPHDVIHGLDPIKHIRTFWMLHSHINAIEFLYKKFRKYQKTQLRVGANEDVSKGTVSSYDIIRDIMDEENGANVSIISIYNLTFGSENMMWDIFVEELDTDFMCKNYHQSQQQIIYNLYNAIALAELKGYMLIQFALMSNRLQERGNYVELSKTARNKFEIIVNDTMAGFRGAMELFPRYIWRCDPKTHVRGETYEEITKLLQGYIQNEVDLNQRGTCTQTCGTYSKTRSYGCYDWRSEYCQKMKRCNGDIYNCHFIESHMEVCISPEHSHRMYDYITLKSGRKMGKSTSCWDKQVKSWHRWFVHCSSCFCLCDAEGPKSDRYFSLRPVLANVDKNYVVTGVRLKKVNRIIHLQIQEGQLLPHGIINQSTVGWVPVDDFTIATGRKGTDYFVLDYSHRTIYLDDLIETQNGRVVTGVTFNHTANFLKFGIQTTPFEFTSGKLTNSSSYYIFGYGEKRRLSVDSTDVPINSPPSEPDHGSNFVEFTHTDFDKDVAQTTVPFLDIQPVFSKPAVPLTGAGLYYKGRSGYGGFIAPKIRTYDFSKHLNLQFPDKGAREDTHVPIEIDVA